MRRRMFEAVREVALGVALLAAALALACSNGGQPGGAGASATTDETGGGASRDLITVVTTLYPLEYFAKRIGGDFVTVRNLVSPGVEAHDFEPTPEDIRTLGAADVFAYNGAGLEFWVDRALEAINAGSIEVVDASSGMEFAGEETEDGRRGGPDPHVWLDPTRAIVQVRALRDGLAASAPQHRQAFDANADALVAELNRLDSRFRDALESCQARFFVTSHEAFGYLALRYDLEVVGITGLSPESEPGPRDLAELSDRLRELGTKYIMAEPIVSSSLADTLAREIGAQVLVMHPLESLTADQTQAGETYFTLMDDNLESLRQALRCAQ